MRNLFGPGGSAAEAVDSMLGISIVPSYCNSPVFLTPLTVARTFSLGGPTICRIGTTSPHSNQQEQAARPSF